MKFLVKPSKLHGAVNIPGSKSHTIRALAFALLAEGESIIKHPLNSADTRSCIDMVERFGAEVCIEENSWRVKGKGGELDIPSDIVDIGNSGTSLYIGLGLASLVKGFTVFTGDHQMRNRPADALLKSITDLRGNAFSTRGNGKPPIIIKGKIRGGETSIKAVTSQYLTSLLIASPLASDNTIIKVPLLNEMPYVVMTLGWLDKLGIKYANKDFKEFHITGNQGYMAFSEQIPADFSSATFPLVAAAITGSELILKGLDFNDTQGDKEVIDILKEMGAKIEIGDNFIRIDGGKLKGGTFDLNSIPDSLPALAVAGCIADGETRLVNVPQARLKETDRISVMNDELKKMGADVEELDDGIIIKRCDLKGAKVDGHSDHRVVMSLSLAGLMANGETIIDTAESVSITFPNFLQLMKSIGSDIQIMEE
ncbi:MAG: 3-phosphoshikimate 1-carboxyvinyltransferase [Spirochaetota bacterium]|nr:3-phosphoshikimate 1-carboxyvinyltransferase [Spirochaetota bacterium]